MPEEKKNKPIHRLDSMYPIRAKINENYAQSAEKTKAGEPVVWAMYTMNFGDAVLKAMDIQACYPENFAGASAAFGVAQPYMDRSDQEGFPTHFCGYSRVGIGYAAMMKDLDGQIPPGAPMGGIAKPMFLLSSTVGCDVRYKWFQAMQRYLDVPIWTFDTPLVGINELEISDGYDQMVKVQKENLKEFIPWAEKITGKKLDWARLEEVAHYMVKINETLDDVNELRKAKPCPMHGRDFWSAMTPAMFLMGDLEDDLKCYQALYDEVKERVANNQGALAVDEKYRLTFSELPPWHSMNVFDKLAERGWNIVTESVGYHPPDRLDYSKISDPLEIITRFSMQKFTSKYKEMKQKNMLDVAMSYAYLKWAREFQCDGILLHPLVSCRSASFGTPSLKTDLMKELKVPSLTMEGDIVDLKVFDMEGTLARAEAFEETMDHYREIRKQEGFEW